MDELIDLVPLTLWLKQLHSYEIKHLYNPLVIPQFYFVPFKPLTSQIIV